MTLQELQEALLKADAAARNENISAEGRAQARADASMFAAEINRMTATPAGAAEDVARSGTGGVMRGTASLMGMGQDILDLPSRVGRRIVGADVEPRQSGAETLKAMLPEAAQRPMEYQPMTRAGGYAGTVGEFLPGAALPIGPAKVMDRVVRGTVIPAVASETAGQSVEALGGGESAQNMARIAAALGTPMAMDLTEYGLRNFLTSGARAYEPGSARQAAVDILEREGTTGITAGQRLGAERLMRLEGVEDPGREAVLSFNKAVMQRLGSSAPRPTREALGALENQLGQVFDEAAALSAVPRLDLAEKAKQSLKNYMELQPDNVKPPTNAAQYVDAIINAAQSGRPITGKQVQQWRSNLRNDISRYTNAEKYDAADFALEVSNTLDDIIVQAARTQADPAVYSRLLDARNRYRDLRTVSSSLNKTGSDNRAGLVSPGALGTRTRQIEGERATVLRPGRQLRPMSELGLAGEEVIGSLPTVRSGGLRSMTDIPAIKAFLASGAAAAASRLPVEQIGAAALGGLAIPYVMGAASRTPYAQRLMQDPSFTSMLSRQAVPSVARLTPGLLAQ